MTMDRTQQASTGNSSESQRTTAEEKIALLGGAKEFDRLTKDIVEFESKHKKFSILLEKIKEIDGGSQYMSGGEIDKLIEKEVGLKPCPNCFALVTYSGYFPQSPHEHDSGSGMAPSFWDCVKVKPKRYNKRGSLECIEQEIKWQNRMIEKSKRERSNFVYGMTGLKM